MSVLIFFYSCKNSTPSGVIRPKEMQEVLWDILRADAIAREISRTDSSKSLETEKISFTKKIFVVHNITKDEFDKSYSYYTDHPDKMKTMLDSLEAQKTRANNSDTVINKIDKPQQLRRYW